MRSNQRGGNGAEEAALQLVQEHAAGLLRFARRYSYCADDAHDAYQRTVEILVRRLRTEPPAHLLSFTRTVLRNEALAVRAEREQLVGRTEIDLDRTEDRQVEDPAERAVGHEQLRQTAEALQRLKPQEVTALVLRAEGLSYREICTHTGWTYTRTNRTVTEGRRALLSRLGAIESGAECSRWLPLLSVLADGEATALELSELRPHLRSCPACRATLRDFHAAPAQVAELVPPILLPLASATAAHGSLLSHAEAALHGLVERATLLAFRVQGSFEALPGAKLAAVAASTAALAGGGVALERAADAQRIPPVAAHADAAAVGVQSARLLTIGGPLQPSSVTSRTRRTGPNGASRAEFASATAGPSEFTPQASQRAEFSASAPEPQRVATVASPSGATAPPSPSASASPSAPSEFDGAEFDGP